MRYRYYGLTESQYVALRRQSAGCCQICDLSVDDNLVIDHDHNLGFVRGLLCRRCNLALGMFGDDARNLILALNYLEEPPALRSIGYHEVPIEVMWNDDNTPAEERAAVRAELAAMMEGDW